MRCWISALPAIAYSLNTFDKIFKAWLLTEHLSLDLQLIEHGLVTASAGTNHNPTFASLGQPAAEPLRSLQSPALSVNFGANLTPTHIPTPFRVLENFHLAVPYSADKQETARLF